MSNGLEAPVPATRSLAAVLRRALADDASPVEILVGKVTAVPDARHVTVEVQGTAAVIPRIAGYFPTVGEGCWCLAGSSVLLALGAVGGATPATPVGAGTASGQVLVWDNGAKAWVAANAVPTASNALALGGSAPATFLQHVLAGAHKTWWSHFGPVNPSGSPLRVTIAHLLGATPALVLVTHTTGGDIFQGVAAYDASTIALGYSAATLVDGWVFALV